MERLHGCTAARLPWATEWNGCTAAQNVTTIQRVPQIDFSKNREKRVEPKDLPEEDIRVLNKIIPDFLFDLQGAGEAFEDLKQMGLSGEQPLGEAKTKAPNSDYHKDEPPVAARQAEVARDYLKRAARIDELNGHPPGSDGQMVTALKMVRSAVPNAGGCQCAKLAPPVTLGVLCEC